MTIVALRSRVPLPERRRRTPMPPRTSAMTSASKPSVGDDEADVDPEGVTLVFGKIGVPLLRVEPLGSDPHQHVGRQAYEQQRPVAEAQHCRVSARECQGRRRSQHAADEDHRADDVQEQNVVPVVGTDGGEQAHAPGFQIMSTRMSSVTRLATACSMRPRCVRLTARSSCARPGLAGCLELLGLLHARHVLGARACADSGRDRPEDDRGDDPPVPDVVSADGEREPDAEDDRAACRRSLPQRFRPSRPAPCGSSPRACRFVRTATIRTQKRTSAATSANALRTWSARIQWSRLTRALIL